MSDYPNPTPLQIGMSGNVGGQHFRVVGRVVMGTEEAGELYFWNEFHVIDDANRSATLVYEETENGPQWRIFTLFEPDQPLSATEAAKKRTGDQFNIAGSAMPVTLVGSSRVCHIDGTAPEGVELGDIAHYFNLEDGNQMVVVSWTGEEVEFFQGIDLPEETVRTAFNLVQQEIPARASAVGPAASAASTPVSGGMMKFIVIALIALFGYGMYSCTSSSVSINVVKKRQPPIARFSVGAKLPINGQILTVAHHSVMEVSKVGMVYHWLEYEVVSETGEHGVLICGLNGDGDQWHLFKRVPSGAAFTPFTGASKRPGDRIVIDGRESRVQEAFRSKCLLHDKMTAGDVQHPNFGFIAKDGNRILVARWDQTAVALIAGEPVASRDLESIINKP